MKTITVKKTKNGNYISCIEGIRKTQSESNLVYVFDANFNFLKSVNANPRFSWVNKYKTLCRIGGVNYNDTEQISTLIKKVVDNKVTGYTTVRMLEQNNFTKLLAPIE
jgi:hypothetical protein